MFKKIKNTLFLGKYRNKIKLGVGSFGEVYLVEDQNGKLSALKLVSKQKMQGQLADVMEQCLKDQINCLQKMQCRHILKLQKFGSDQEFYYMFLEYCDGGDFTNQQYYYPNKVYPLDVAVQFMSQVIKGLQELHTKGYLHRDIKPQNLLVKNQNQEKIIKLGDFGLSKDVTRIEGTYCGTESFLSPEILACQKEGEDNYGFEVDMWSFGVTFFYMLNYAYPFQNAHPSWSKQEKSKWIKKQAYDFSYRKKVQQTSKKIMQNCTDQMEDLFRKMFELKPQKRIKFSQIRIHPIFSKYFPNSSPHSILLYEDKFKIKTFRQIGTKKIKVNQNKQLKIINQKPGTSSIIEDYEEDKYFPRQFQIVQLEKQEIDFLKNLCQDIKLIRKYIDLTIASMFQFNLHKYYVILFNRFIKDLKKKNYMNKYPQKGLKWIQFFDKSDFKYLKEKYALEFARAEAKLADLYNRCFLQQQQIIQVNPFFKNIFNLTIEQENKFQTFYDSYRQSTGLIYQNLRETLKVTKNINLYYYLCTTCILHFWNSLLGKEQLRTNLFIDYIKQKLIESSEFSFKDFRAYLLNCGKKRLIALSVKIIEDLKDE